MAIPFIDLAAQYRLLKKDIDRRIQTVLDHGCYILGPEVRELEEQLADYVGVKHAIGVSDGTTALQLSLMALGIKPGDEVIMPSFTFIATAEVAVLLGAKPVFIDIDPVNYNLNPDLIEAVITPCTKAIIAVNLYGQCADFDAINAIALRHHLAVVEDAAQSFGATYKGEKSCSLATIGCTSFFPSKPLGSYGDGGMCFTQDDALAQALREIRVHGQGSKRYDHVRVGVNGRLDTLQAAILLAKLPTFDEEVVARQQVAARYTKLLCEWVRTPILQPYSTSVYAQYTIELDDRHQAQARLQEKGIPTAVHYPIPLHKQKAFEGILTNQEKCPQADAAASRVMSLPMSPFLDQMTQDRVVSALKTMLQAA